MGPRPIHPDEQPLPVVCQVLYSDDDDDYDEEEEEPKYLWIHHNNPVPDHALQYKKDKQACWLAAKQKKHEKSTWDKTITSYFQTLAAWEKQPRRIP